MTRRSRRTSKVWLVACDITVSPYGPSLCSLNLYIAVSGGDDCSEYRLFYRSEHTLLVMMLQRFTMINSLCDESNDF